MKWQGSFTMEPFPLFMPAGQCTIVGAAMPPPPHMAMPPATTPAPEPSPAMDLPLTPIAPSVPAQAEAPRLAEHPAEPRFEDYAFAW